MEFETITEQYFLSKKIPHNSIGILIDLSDTFNFVLKFKFEDEDCLSKLCPNI
jgi:hypothetical protein